MAKPASLETVYRVDIIWSPNPAAAEVESYDWERLHGAWPTYEIAERHAARVVLENEGIIAWRVVCQEHSVWRVVTVGKEPVEDG